MGIGPEAGGKTALGSSEQSMWVLQPGLRAKPLPGSPNVKVAEDVGPVGTDVGVVATGGHHQADDVMRREGQ